MGERGINNKGSSLLLVLVIISAAAVLGSAAINKAVFNQRLQNREIESEKNFYLLETAVDEIYCALEQAAENAVGSGYEQVLCGLYTIYMTNDEANEAFVQNCVDQLGEQFDVDFWRGDTEEIAERLQACAVTVPQENFILELGKIEIDSAGQVVLEELCFTYTDPDTEESVSVTASFTVNIPEIFFIEDDCLSPDCGESYSILDHKEILSVTFWKRGIGNK